LAPNDPGSGEMPTMAIERGRNSRATGTGSCADL
jgi:hypothetical protein